MTLLLLYAAWNCYWWYMIKGTPLYWWVVERERVPSAHAGEKRPETSIGDKGWSRRGWTGRSWGGRYVGCPELPNKGVSPSLHTQLCSHLDSLTLPYTLYICLLCGVRVLITGVSFCVCRATERLPVSCHRGTWVGGWDVTGGCMEVWGVKGFCIYTGGRIYVRMYIHTYL